MRINSLKNIWTIHQNLYYNSIIVHHSSQSISNSIIEHQNILTSGDTKWKLQMEHLCVYPSARECLCMYSSAWDTYVRIHLHENSYVVWIHLHWNTYVTTWGICNMAWGHSLISIGSIPLQLYCSMLLAYSIFVYDSSMYIIHCAIDPLSYQFFILLCCLEMCPFLQQSKSVRPWRYSYLFSSANTPVHCT